MKQALYIEAPIYCPSCQGSGFDSFGACYLCEGTGRLLFQQQEPSFLIKLNRWWNELPYWKRYNIIGAFVFGVGLLVALAVVGLIDKWWPQ